MRLAAALVVALVGFVSPAGAELLYNPGDIIIGESRFGGAVHPRIVAIDPATGSTSVITELGLLYTVSGGITIDHQGDILVVDRESCGIPSCISRVIRVDADTGDQNIVAELPAAEATPGHPDRDGTSLFVALRGNVTSVLRIDLLLGTFSTVSFGGFLTGVGGLAVNSPDSLLVATNNNIIRVDTDSGFQSIAAPGFGARDIVFSAGIPTIASDTGVIQLDPQLGPTLISASDGSFGPVAIDVLADETFVVASETGPKQVVLVDPQDGSRESIYISELLGDVAVAPLPSPTGATLSPGDILVVNAGTARGDVGSLVKIDPSSGEQTLLVASTGPAGEPLGVAATAQGGAFMADVGVQAVIHVDPPTTEQSVLDTNGALSAPVDVAVSDNGLLVLDVDPSVGVVRVNPSTGEETPVSADGDLAESTGLAADSGLIFVADKGTGGVGTVVRIQADTGDQTVVASIFGIPSDVAVESEEALVVVDRENGALVRINRTTGAQTPLSLGFVDPVGVAVEEDGNLLVSDTGFLAGDPAIVRVAPDTGDKAVLASGGFLKDPAGLAVVPVPEPTTTLLRLVALVGVGLLARRR